MLTHKSGKRYLVSPAEEFIKYFIRKKSHVSFFYAAEELRFEIVSDDDVAKRTVTMSILGTLISEGYKTVKARITVTPREEDITKSCLEYTFEFDKIKNHIRKTEIVESLLTYIDISDTNNNRSDDNFKYNSFDAGYPAEEYFKRKVKAFKEDDDDVTVGGVNRKNKRFTVSFISAPFLSDSYEDGSIFQSMEVTITITPKKDDNSRSRVKWTIKVEKFDYSKEQADFFLIAADHIRETIMAA
ncbi:unnamed protein product [Brassica napus]|uniref:(rape) hypothetical protein n=1 Tax=Brassica napus TaxID=3708 RepID=A0A816JFP5_BRANA|nr:unnamed protein product [Brassica napus]